MSKNPNNLDAVVEICSILTASYVGRFYHLLTQYEKEKIWPPDYQFRYEKV